MLAYATICPHPPILLPPIGKENLNFVISTIKALRKIEAELYTIKPETIVVITPHGQALVNSFSVSVAPKYYSVLEQFGDFTTKLEFKADLELIYKIKENLETKIPFNLISSQEIDHGVSVPLYFLTDHLKNISIVPLNYSLLSYQAHLEFGRLLKEEIIKSPKKIVLIASGDLSHRLTPDAPAGFSPQGKIFDHTLIKLLKKRDIQAVLNLDSTFIEEAGECGFRSILILLGILEKINYQFKVLSYEAPFGVGYLVAKMVF